MILTKNIKAVVLCADGELTFEFRRPTNRERNDYYAATLDIREEGAARMNRMDELRIALFDRFIAAVYVEKEGGVRSDLTDEAGAPLAPKDLPEDLKTQAVSAVFERSRVLPKNV